MTGLMRLRGGFFRDPSANWVADYELNLVQVTII